MAYEWNLPEVIGRLRRGDSFFVPCLAVDELRKKILAEAERQGVKVSVRFVIEGELQGLRTWRR